MSELRFVNVPVTSGVIKQLFARALGAKRYSNEEIVGMIDRVKNLGFEAGTISGLSFGITDPKILSDKDLVIQEANVEVARIEENFRSGLITT